MPRSARQPDPRAGRPLRRSAGLALLALALLAAPSLAGFGPIAQPAAGAAAESSWSPLAELVPLVLASTAEALQPAARSDDFDYSQHSLSNPNSPWVVLNKHRPIRKGSTWSPPDLVSVRTPNAWNQPLRKQTEAALYAMYRAAKKDGVGLFVESAYRPYSVQANLFSGFVRSRGQQTAEQISARPGYSEHQLGTTVDLGGRPAKCSFMNCFATTKYGKWLDAHAWEYGFILRDQRDKSPITGWAWEAWHFRWVGKELAAEMRAQGITTLEEFFELPAAPDYR